MKITIEIEKTEQDALLDRWSRFVGEVSRTVFATMKEITRNEKETVEDDLDEDPDYVLFQEGLSALDWCSGSGAFCVGGYARAGWERLCVPLRVKLCRRIAVDLPSGSFDVPLLHELAQALTWCGNASDDFKLGGSMRAGWEYQIPPFIEKVCLRLGTTRDVVQRQVNEWPDLPGTRG